VQKVINETSDIYFSKTIDKTFLTFSARWCHFCMQHYILIY